MKSNLDGHLLSGTRVATPRGLRRIDDISVGDEVFGRDTRRGKLKVQRVEAVQRTQTREVRRIACATGAVLVWESERPHVEAIAEISATEAPTPAFDVFALELGGPNASYFADGVLVQA